MISALLAVTITFLTVESTMPTHPAAPVADPVADDTAISRAFEAGQLARKVQMGREGVELFDRSVVEDDGAGSVSYSTAWDTPKGVIRGPLQVKKILHLRRPGCRKAHLAMLVWPESLETEPLEVTVNGDEAARKIVNAGEPTPSGWHAVELPPSALRQGDNEILLRCRGRIGWGVGVARREDIVRNDPERQAAPVRSFASADAGATWVEGVSAADSETTDGEFMIRMTLAQSAAEGVLIGPVIDLAADGDEEIAIAAATSADSARLLLDAEVPTGASVTLALRSGPGPVVDDDWGPWLTANTEGVVSGPMQRFVQWRAVLAAEDPTVTPAVKAVSVEAQTDSRPAPWAEKIQVRSAHNETIRYTSIPFEYERFDEPQLKELRETYKLDDVVAGAATEMEKMRKLHNWVSTQWKYDPPQAPYPAWDAREILERRQGFCVQYAVVYMQCALSLGMQTRFVFGAFPNAVLKGQSVCGHEVNEYWSNEYGKWVMVDANRNEMFLDAETGVPKSMLQLRDEQLRLYSPDSPLGFEPLEIDAVKPSPSLKVWKGGADAPEADPPRMALKWGCLHWMPRNNMYAHRYPEPMAQGRVAWSWNGYWHWDDGLTPRDWQWETYTGRQSDLDWTINQVRWAAQAADSPGEVLLRLGTVTPDFDTFLASIDGGPWRPVTDKLTWTLHEGTNRIEFRIRNRAGILGVISHIELGYQP